MPPGAATDQHVPRTIGGCRVGGACAHRPRMRNIIIRVAIIGAVIVGGLIFRDRLSGNAGELAVGDCFDVPTADTNISDVQHHPCTEAHTGEVFFVGAHTAAKGTPFTTSLLETYVGSACIPAFMSYIGSGDSTPLEIGAFYPLVKDWDDGDREVTCYLYQIDGSTMTKTLKAA